MAAQGTDAVVDGLAFGRGPVSGLGRAEELAKIRVAGKVADEGANRADVQVEAVEALRTS